MTPGAVVITFPAHVQPAILCIVLALVVIVIVFCAVATGGGRERR